jgi:hypothetical protein
MKRHMLLIAVLLLLATIPPVQAQPQEYTIQRTERPSDGVHYVIGFSDYAQPPEIEVQNGTLGIVSIVGESSVYRGTIAFRLNWCNSRLIVDSRTVVEQRCLWFPLAVKR